MGCRAGVQSPIEEEPSLKRPLRSLRWLALPTLLVITTGCPDNGGPQCPPEFKAGELCEIEDLVCRIPGSQCEDTLCTCTNEVGGLYWDCSKVPYCRCTCPCGKIALNTCESLGCSPKAQDPCPAKAKAVCDLVCREPDAGPDLAPADLGQDLLDQGQDISVDQQVDLPPADLPPADVAPDLPAPDVSLPDVAPPDQPMDLPMDLAPPVDLPADGG